MMPRVSVIVPVYNTEKYLAKSLDSLVNQSRRDIEIIIVDDGSTDGSAQIINDYQQDHPRKIRVISKKNGGLSEARNFGIEAATGDFLSFVDSDDWCQPDMFADMLSLADKYSADLVICNLQKVDENGRITQRLTQIPHLPEKIELEKHFEVFADLSYFACNKLFRRELFADLRFKVGAHFEDIQLIPQLLLQSKIIAQTQKFHYQYFERHGSISKTHNLRGLDILRAVEDVEKAFAKSHFSHHKKQLQGFQILEGVYTFLAYLAFVKNDGDYQKMRAALREFMRSRGITVTAVLGYRRFGKNYLLSLPLKKICYYLLFFGRQHWLLKVLR